MSHFRLLQNTNQHVAVLLVCSFNTSLCFHSQDIAYFLAAFREQQWAVVNAQPQHSTLVMTVESGWLQELVIVNWNVDCVWAHVHKEPAKNTISSIDQCSLFCFKLIKCFEVRPDPAGTTVTPITRTLLCPAEPINLQFLDRRVEQEEPRAAAGASLWAVAQNASLIKHVEGCTAGSVMVNSYKESFPHLVSFPQMPCGFSVASEQKASWVHTRGQQGWLHCVEFASSPHVCYAKYFYCQEMP